MSHRQLGRAVVTGGASGLGHHVATTLLDRGWQVVLVDRDADALARASHQLDARHRGLVASVVSDLSTPTGIHDVAGAVGDVTALVNNAGGWMTGPQYPEAPEETWTSALTLNLLAPMMLTQLLWPRLAEAAGAVVNVGSSGGLGDAPYESPEYGAAKAGLRRFTSSLGGRNDVRVMAVVPGWIGLERAVRERAALGPAERRSAAPLVPPDRVAAAVADLLDDGRPGEVVELLSP